MFQDGNRDEPGLDGEEETEVNNGDKKEDEKKEDTAGLYYVSDDQKGHKYLGEGGAHVVNGMGLAIFDSYTMQDR